MKGRSSPGFRALDQIAGGWDPINKLKRKKKESRLITSEYSILKVLLDLSRFSKRRAGTREVSQPVCSDAK